MPETPETPVETPETETESVEEQPQDEQPEQPENVEEEPEKEEPEKPEAPAAPEKPEKKEEPAKPEPQQPPAAPAPDPKAIEAERAALTAYQNWERDFAALDNEMADEKKDVIDYGPKAIKTLKAGIEYVRAGLQYLSGQVNAQQQAATASQFWGNWARENPDLGDKGESLFREAIHAVASEYPGADDKSIIMAATERWNSALAAERAKSKQPSTRQPKPAPPVTRGGAQVKPPGTPNVAPQRPKESAADRILRELGTPEKVLK